MKLFLLIFIGGGLGSMARYGMTRLVAPYLVTFLPLATFGVNIIGSFLIGLFGAIPFVSEKNSLLSFLTIGFCGGFTTFSAFSWENFNLLKQGDVVLFFGYVLSSVIFCLLATWGGYTLGKSFF